MAAISIQKTAARLVTTAQRRDHITPILYSILHDFRVRQRAAFKITVSVWKCLHNTALHINRNSDASQWETVLGRPQVRFPSQLQISIGQRSFTFHWSNDLRNNSSALNTVQ